MSFRRTLGGGVQLSAGPLLVEYFPFFGASFGIGAYVTWRGLQIELELLRYGLNIELRWR